MARKPASGNMFTPKNTLNRNYHNPQNRDVAQSKAYPAKLQTRQARGNNVKHATTALGEGFEESPNKRRKIDNGTKHAPRPASPSVVVPEDLRSTGSSDEVLLSGRPVSSETRKATSNSQTSTKTGPNPKERNPFSNSALRDADAPLRAPKSQRAPKSSFTQPSRQKASPIARQNGGTSNQPVVIDEETAWEKARPDVEQTSGTGHTSRRGPGSANARLNQESVHQRRFGMEGDAVLSRAGPGSRGSNSEFHATDDPLQLSAYFNPKSKVKAKDKMQTCSDVHGTRDSISSADELASSTTIGNYSAGNRAGAGRSRHERSPSTSDIRPTTFTHSGRKAMIKRDEPPSPVPPTQDSDADTKAVPIVAFYARACVAEGANLELVFDGDGLVYLHQNGKRIVAADGNVMVYIDGLAAKQFSYSQNSNFVTINGSTNGYICVALHEYADVKWLMDCLQTTTDDKMAVIHTETQHLKRVFSRQAAELQHWHAKRSAKVPAVDEGMERKMLERQHAKNTSAQHPREERIQYETDGGDAPVVHGVKDRTAASTVKHQDRLSYRPLYVSNVNTIKDQDSDRRRSARAPPKVRSPSPEFVAKWTEIHKPQAWPHPVVYPSEGPRRTTTDFGDLMRLDEGEFLNDNLISFALRRTEESLSPEQRGRIHFFNTFFYSSLSTNNGRRAFNYDSVKRWTKGKDLMGTPYVVVPINHDLHWFVAIICNLNRFTQQIEFDPSDDEVQAVDHAGTVKANGKEELDVEMEDLALSEGDKSKDSGNDQILSEALTSATAGREGDGESRPSTGTSKKSKKKGPPPLPKIDSQQPAIITLDSFGSAHTGEVRMLKDYVIEEAKDKRGMTVSRDQMKGITAKGLPEQTNFCDCGVYLVGYIQEFAKDPDGFVRKVLSRELDRNNDFVSFNPSAKRDELRDTLLELQKQQEIDRKEKKRAKSATNPRSTAITLPTVSAAGGSSPAQKTPSKPAGTQMPRLPIEPQPESRKSLSPTKPPPPSRTEPPSSAEAQVQEELATAAPIRQTPPDENVPVDTVPNPPEPSDARASPGVLRSSQSFEGFGNDQDEMLDGAAGDYVVSRGKHVEIKQDVSSETAPGDTPKMQSRDELLDPLQEIVKDSQGSQ
ncbi:hypothetical protein MBLNU230_g0455t1 [Neophaeotheca triangularis]